jgi:hypothetical protein
MVRQNNAERQPAQTTGIDWSQGQMTARQAYLRLWFILLVFTVFGTAYIFWHPFQHPADELAHFRYSRFVAQHGRLPITLEEREEAGYRSDWPGLYQLIVGAANFWNVSDSPSNIRIISASEILNTEDERWPVSGDVLMWYIGRFISLAMSAGTVLITFYTALQISPGNYRLAVWSSAVTASIPTFVFMSAAVSDDPLLGLLASLYFLLLVKIVRDDTRLRTLFLLGVVLGISVTAKYSTVILAVEVVIVFAFLAWQNHWGWRNWAGRVFVVGITSMVFAGWWFVFLVVYFNDIETYGPVIGALKPILAGGIDVGQNYTAALLTGGRIGTTTSNYIVPDPFYAWAWQMYRTVWVSNIGDLYPLGWPGFLFIGVFIILAMISLFNAWRSRPQKRIWIALLLFHTALFFVFPLLRYAIQGNIAWTAQGRHVLFPLATVIPLLLIYGWDGWVSLKTERYLALVLVAGFLTWNSAQLIRAATFYNPPVPVRKAPYGAGAISQPVNETVGDVHLLGYNAVTSRNALQVELFWRSSEHIEQDFLRRVNLVRDGETKLEWLSYPTDGRYRSFRWRAGDIIRDEVWLPVAGLPAGQYQLQVELLDRNTLAVVDRPVDLGMITAGEAALPRGGVPLSVKADDEQILSGVRLWNPPRKRESGLPTYWAGATVALQWNGQPEPDQQVFWYLVDPNGVQYPTEWGRLNFNYATVNLSRPANPESITTAGWPSGDYYLRVEVWQDNAVVAAEDTPPVLSIVNDRPHLFKAPAIPTPLAANFANQVKLLGYHLPNIVLYDKPGIPMTLFWQGLADMDESFTIFAKLFSDDHQQLWANTDRLPADGYPTTEWWAGEVVVDGFELMMEPDIPSGVYWINVGLYLVVDESGFPLPLIVDDQPSEVTSVSFGPVKVGGPPPGVVKRAEEISPEFPVSLRFGERPEIGLRGYDLARVGDNLELTLYWESLATTANNWSTFVHLRNESNETVAQKDGPTGGSRGVRYWTSLWEPGEIIVDTLTVPIPIDLTAGQYKLVVGLYDLQSGQRMLLPESQTNEFVLDSLEFPR